MGRKITFWREGSLDRVCRRISLDDEFSEREPIFSRELRKNTMLRDTISWQISNFLRENVDGNSKEAGQIIKELNRGSKRIIDGAIALSLLTLLSPLIVVVACAIKLESKGPVFFTQHRTGFMGRRFKMYKFRTMVVNADAMKGQFRHLNFHQYCTPDFKIRNDPRITGLGAFLRKYSLDEIPQLWNVVIGDMRLVGPRPTSFSAETYEPSHLSRLMVFPGLTGIWQISGRSNLQFDERVRLDCKYIIEYTMLLDLKILLRTPLAVIKGDGAY